MSGVPEAVYDSLICFSGSVTEQELQELADFLAHTHNNAYLTFLKIQRCTSQAGWQWMEMLGIANGLHEYELYRKAKTELKRHWKKSPYMRIAREKEAEQSANQERSPGEPVRSKGKRSNENRS